MKKGVRSHREENKGGGAKEEEVDCWEPGEWSRRDEEKVMVVVETGKSGIDGGLKEEVKRSERVRTKEDGRGGGDKRVSRVEGVNVPRGGGDSEHPSSRWTPCAL